MRAARSRDDKEIIRTPDHDAGSSDASLRYEIVHTIMMLSLGPSLLKERMERILAYLVSIEELDLLPMAALFLVEQDSRSLTLAIQHGLSGQQRLSCRHVPFGRCYCGKAASDNTIQFTDDASDHTQNRSAAEHSHGHYCLPFGSHGIVDGVLCLFLPRSHERTARREELLATIAEIIGKIIETQKMDLQLVNLVNDLRGSIIALREEKRFSDSIIQGLEHGLVITDHHGTVQKCNEVARNILSPFSPEIEGRTLASIIGEENAEKILTFDTRSHPHREKELSLPLDSGEVLILRYSAVEKKDGQERPGGAIVSLTDVSEWRHVRKEMEKMNRLSTVAEIASAVAHEVRNPLAGIKIMAQSIEEDSCTEEERVECAQRIIRQVDRLNELLTEFFSYARPVVPKKQAVALQSVLAETKPLISTKLVKQRIDLHESFAPDLPRVMADPNQIQQVFLNLFLNAIDAIRQEGVIEVSALPLSGLKLARYRRKNHLLEKGGRYVMVVFSDNGAGMTGEAEEKVFEPFFTTKTNGSGLGMSIVYRTLKENDASIIVSSSEGKGTTFTMFFKAI